MTVHDEVIQELNLEPDAGPHETLQARIFSWIPDEKTGRQWEVIINGKFTANYKLRADAYRLLSGILLKLSIRDELVRCGNEDCDNCHIDNRNDDDVVTET